MESLEEMMRMDKAKLSAPVKTINVSYLKYFHIRFVSICDQRLLAQIDNFQTNVICSFDFSNDAYHV